VLRNFLHCVDVVFVWGGRKSLPSIIGADGMLSVNISGEEMRKRKREGLAGRLCQLTRPSHPSVSLFYKHTNTTRAAAAAAVFFYKFDLVIDLCIYIPRIIECNMARECCTPFSRTISFASFCISSVAVQ
jgi:hypothetical protein